MINLEIHEGFRSQVDSRLIERAAQATLDHQSTPQKAELTIVVTDNQQIQELNRQFRGVDAPTDVLSFPAGFTNPEDQSSYLGDVILDYPLAAQQAEEIGHPVEAEIQLLVVHGILHLLGHDHAETAEKARMWGAQGEILRQLGIDHIQVEREA